MDKKSVPDELDVFISLLGEIDMIKNQLSMLDKNTHITLSQNNDVLDFNIEEGKENKELCIYEIDQESKKYVFCPDDF